MRILTFGSCLARYTMEHFIMLFGGKIVTSVFHNRSDAFVGKFLNQDWHSYDFDEMNRLLKTDSVIDNPDADPALVLRNQYKKTIGLHRLPGGLSLFSALKRKNIDLIVADNYMDLAARLVSKKGDNNAGVFLRSFDFASDDSTWVRGEFLEPTEGVRHMQRILRFFRARAPEARFVFLNFPHNMYTSSPDRVQRTKVYEKLFNFDGALIVPCLRINPLFQTKNKQHFKPEQYCAYAGLIHQHLTQVGFPTVHARRNRNSALRPDSSGTLSDPLKELSETSLSGNA